MGRGRISMKLVQKEKSRQKTFLTRKNGLMKKVKELSTLCDVDVCVILYAPNFQGQGFVEPETWPKDPSEVQSVLQKYYNTTNDRRLRIYDIQEYFKGKMKKVESEIFNVHKKMLKVMYPTWNESFNSFGEEQLRLFASMLDSKLDACNQRMNMLKGDHNGKAITESHKVDKLPNSNTPYLTSNPSSYFNLMQNNFSIISDKNPFEFWPLELGQMSSQPSSMFSSAQGSYQVQSYPYNHVDANWAHQVDANVTYDPKIDTKMKDGAENAENLSSSYYYNGNTPAMQSYHHNAMQTLPFDQNLPNLMDFNFNGFYDIDGKE
ncbi:agamous-like MADS-box protein AGL12 [Trifolium pratense]|uniref:agamous-like MADS-box protein AGL12 n=1 Tax=Trifolium pratense TaxID=57577 RepID=UPI001E6954F9|nr:agamous-like MADS-box protein AGL12 [Trifolium pratense]